MGYPPCQETDQHSKHLLCGGRYASCVHAGGLSCSKLFCGQLFNNYRLRTKYEGNVLIGYPSPGWGFPVYPCPVGVPLSSLIPEDLGQEYGKDQ